jgi:hypothetical protein
VLLTLACRRQAAAPQDVPYCALTAVVNVQLTTTPGEYRVGVRVSFSSPQVQ